MTKEQKLFPGTRIGQLRLIMRVAPKKTGSPALRKRWRCECDCGERLTVPEAYLLRDPHPKSHCGGKVHTQTFNSANKRERGIWLMMRVRCYNPDHVGYKHYGARGIRVCDEWLNDPDGFPAFMAHIGPAPSKNHTLDRIDPDRNYEPGNVRWATWKEQNNNKREHKKIQYRKPPGLDDKDKESAT